MPRPVEARRVERLHQLTGGDRANVRDAQGVAEFVPHNVPQEDVAVGRAAPVLGRVEHHVTQRGVVVVREDIRAAVDRPRADADIAAHAGDGVRDRRGCAVVGVVGDDDALKGDAAELLPAVKALLKARDPQRAVVAEARVERGEEIARARRLTHAALNKCAVGNEAPGDRDWIAYRARPARIGVVAKLQRLHRLVDGGHDFRRRIGREARRQRHAAFLKSRGPARLRRQVRTPLRLRRIREQDECREKRDECTRRWAQKRGVQLFAFRLEKLPSRRAAAGSLSRGWARPRWSAPSQA